MSYRTAQTLQYGVTLAQESRAVRPHVPTLKHCNWVFPHTPECYGLFSSRSAGRPSCGVLTVPAASIECLPRAARKGGTFCFRKTGFSRADGGIVAVSNLHRLPLPKTTRRICFPSSPGAT